MKKLGLLFTASLIFFGCAGTKKKSSALPHLKGNTNVSDRAEFQFVSTTSAHHCFLVTNVSPNAQFTRLVPILPGVDMRKAYQPATLKTGDVLIGIDKKLRWNSSEELHEALRTAYQSSAHVTLQFIEQDTGQIKHIIANDAHALTDVTFISGYVVLPVIQVTDVSSSGWAMRNGLQIGDRIVGELEFQSATIRRSKLPLVTYARNEFPTERKPVANAEGISGFLNTMFQDVTPYQPNNNRNGVMGYAALLRVSIVRDDKLVLADLPYVRYIGLGTQFGCDPYCGKAPPVVKAIFSNSSGARAGFQLEDIVLSINGKSVHNSWDAAQRLRKLNYGDKAVCRVMRKDQLVDITAVVDWVVEN